MFKIKSYQEHRIKPFSLTLICVSSNISSLGKFYELINHCISPFVTYLSVLLFFYDLLMFFLFEYKYCVSSVYVNIPSQTAFSLFFCFCNNVGNFQYVYWPLIYHLFGSKCLSILSIFIKHICIFIVKKTRTLFA